MEGRACDSTSALQRFFLDPCTIHAIGKNQNPSMTAPRSLRMKCGVQSFTAENFKKHYLTGFPRIWPNAQTLIISDLDDQLIRHEIPKISFMCDRKGQEKS